MLGKQLRVLGIDGITIRIMIGSILAMRAVCKNTRLNIPTAWNTVVLRLIRRERERTTGGEI